MVNLLPRSALQRARREYYARLAALSLFALSIVFVSSAAFLTPSYLFARIGRAAALERLAILTRDKEASTASASAELVRTAELVAAARLSAAAMPLLAALLEARGEGVTLTRISLEAGEPARLSVRGAAKSREALLALRSALERDPLFKAVELPISDLAKPSDIEFSLTVHVAPAPAPTP